MRKVNLMLPYVPNAVYSRLMLNKTEEKESWTKKKRNIFCENKFFKKRKP